MREIPETWTCRKKHGPLTREGFYVLPHTPHVDGTPSIRIKCKACEKDKISARYKADPAGFNARLKAWRADNPEVSKEHSRKNYWTHRDDRLSYDKSRRDERRRAVLSHYSDGRLACLLCGEDGYEFLCLDHVDGGGNKHRAEHNMSASDPTYKRILKEGFPPGFRILCHNCNRFSKREDRTFAKEFGPMVFPPFISGNRQAWAAKTACVRHYGGEDPRCACCRLSNFDCMTVDHLNGGGRKHREGLGSFGIGGRFHVWLLRQGLPDGYRILCFNCNFGAGAYGECPHVRSRSL